MAYATIFIHEFFFKLCAIRMLIRSGTLKISKKLGLPKITKIL